MQLANFEEHAQSMQPLNSIASLASSLCTRRYQGQTLRRKPEAQPLHQILPLTNITLLLLLLVLLLLLSVAETTAIRTVLTAEVKTATSNPEIPRPASGSPRPAQAHSGRPHPHPEAPRRESRGTGRLPASAAALGGKLQVDGSPLYLKERGIS